MRDASKINRVRKSFKYLSLCSAAVAVTLPALPSYAQSNDTAVDEDVIIVTARRKSENILDVPGSVTAITGATLAKVGVERACLLYTSPSPRDQRGSRMPSSA